MTKATNSIINFQNPDVVDVVVWEVECTFKG